MCVCLRSGVDFELAQVTHLGLHVLSHAVELRPEGELELQQLFLLLVETFVLLP